MIQKKALPTILLIELDDDTRPLLKHNLGRQGYRMIEALEEEDAIILASTEQGRPDLILLNQVELSIDEFLNVGRRIRQKAKLLSSTPVVVTAERFGSDLEGKNIKVGENDYVAYLEDGQQLINLLHCLLLEAITSQQIKHLTD